jgi:hypothetical protein
MEIGKGAERRVSSKDDFPYSEDDPWIEDLRLTLREI